MELAADVLAISMVTLIFGSVAVLVKVWPFADMAQGASLRRQGRGCDQYRRKDYAVLALNIPLYSVSGTALPIPTQTLTDLSFMASHYATVGRDQARRFMPLLYLSAGKPVHLGNCGPLEISGT
jgi:hypothetical protein